MIDRRIPTLRSFVAWSLLAGIGHLLIGIAGLVPAYLVAVVVLADLDRRILGAVGFFAVALAGLSVVLASRGDVSDVHIGFVTRSFLPHNLTFIGFTLVLSSIVLDGRTAGAVPDAPRRPVDDDGDGPPDEPLAGRSAALRIGLFSLVAIVSLVVAIGVA